MPPTLTSDLISRLAACGDFYSGKQRPVHLAFSLVRNRAPSHFRPPVEYDRSAIGECNAREELRHLDVQNVSSHFEPELKLTRWMASIQQSAA